MRTAVTVAQMLVRVCGVVQIVLGILFWTGSAPGLVPVHILIGIVLVLSLWALVALGTRAGLHAGQVTVAVLWGVVVVVFGLTQDSILQSGPHWVIRILHLLVGLAAIGMAEGLGARIKRSPAAAGPAVS